MELPLEKSIKSLCSESAGFNIVYFKDLKLPPDSPPHFYISISLRDNQCLLLCIVTSQMQKLEKIYRSRNQIKAINCLLPLSPANFNSLTRNCVVNCNDAQMLTVEEMENRINDFQNNGLKFVHFDSEFSIDLKKDIIAAIDNSPIVKPIIKKALYKVNPSAS